MQWLIAFAVLVTFANAWATPYRRAIVASNDIPPPQPVAGESIDQWLDQLFGPDNLTSTSAIPSFPVNGSSPIISRSAKRPTTVTKRDIHSSDYKEYNGIHELSWINVTEQTGYNLTVDFSNSCTGLNLSSNVGMYTFTNGTTTESTPLKDLIVDIWSLAPKASDTRRRWANHTAIIAQLGLDEGNNALNSGLICQNDSASSVATKAMTGATGGVDDEYQGPVHNELRRLLASRWSYWTAAILNFVLGAAAGGGIAAGAQYAFTGNVTAQNVVQTSAVVGATILFGGILMRMHEVGRLDRAAEVANARAARGREAVVQNVQMAFWRGLVAQNRRHSIDRAFDDSASFDVGGFSADGTTTPQTDFGGSTPHDTSTPGGGRKSGQYLCLSHEDAARAVMALGQMSSEEMRLRMMSTIAEDQLFRMEEGQAGPNGSMIGPSGQSSSRCPWDVQGRGNSRLNFDPMGGTATAIASASAVSGTADSSAAAAAAARASPSGFAVLGSTGRVGEASALDLVELGNMAGGASANMASSSTDMMASGSGSGSGSWP